MRITVIGTGYLGAVHAACMADIGHEVLGVDVDEAKIAALAEGRPPFFEPGLPDLLARTHERGNLRFGTSLQEAAEFGDVHFVCVGTPQRKGSYAADLKYVDAVVEGLARHLDRPSLIVGKSTVPVGTAARLAARIAELAPQAELAWNPEFLREGTAVLDTLEPDRLVVGVQSAHAADVLRSLYGRMVEAGTPFLVTDMATAELVKVAANSFLATKISFINAMAEVCEATGADVVPLAQAIGMDARIGPKFLAAGLGFGGGCLPKDIRAFIARAGELGVDQAVSFLREVDEINLRRRARTVELGLDLIDGSYRGTRIAVLGAAFKPNSDDIRDSPALDVAASIGRRGGDVVVYDPQALDNARRAHPELAYVNSLDEALTGADVTMVLTEWDEFQDMDPVAVGEQVAQRNMVDGRNILDPVAWRKAGWRYRALGRP